MKLTKEVKEEIDRLYNIYNKITPEILLDHGSDPESPLHQYFEWNQEKAAESYRLVQAYKLIRSYQIKRETEKGVVKMRKYHVITSSEEDKGDYKDIDDVINDDYMKQILEKQILDNLRAAYNKYLSFKKLTDSEKYDGIMHHVEQIIA